METSKGIRLFKHGFLYTAYADDSTSFKEIFDQLKYL